MIVGHEIRDITEKVYTHRTLEDLKNEMKKSKNNDQRRSLSAAFSISKVLATSVRYVLAMC